VKSCKKVKAEVERRIPSRMQGWIDDKRSGNSTCYSTVFFSAAFYLLIILSTHRVCSSPQGVTMSFSSRLTYQSSPMGMYALFATADDRIVRDVIFIKVNISIIPIRQVILWNH
jgi:hypothetical protein